MYYKKTHLGGFFYLLSAVYWILLLLYGILWVSHRARASSNNTPFCLKCTRCCKSFSWTGHAPLTTPHMTSRLPPNASKTFMLSLPQLASSSDLKSRLHRCHSWLCVFEVPDSTPVFVTHRWNSRAGKLCFYICKPHAGQICTPVFPHPRKTCQESVSWVNH